MYCGDSIPPSHASSNNEVLINFHSDEGNIFGNTYGGFKMEYNPTGKQITTIQNNTEIIYIYAEFQLHSSNLPNANDCQQGGIGVKNS